MSAQLSYSINQAVAYEGQLYDANAPRDVVSGVVETAAGIGFGLVVSRGTADNQVVLGGTAFLGIAIRDLARESASGGTIKYNQYETAGILRKGYIWCKCPDGCVPGDAVNYVEATGVLGSGAAVGTGETTLDGATWESTAAAGGLAILRLDTAAVTPGV